MMHGQPIIKVCKKVW